LVVNVEGDTNANASQEAAADSPRVLPLTPMDKKLGGEWTLTMLPSHLALADAPGAQPYVILREQLMKSVTLIEAPRVLVIEKPRKLMFKMTPEGAKVLADWIGNSFLASFYLKRRYTWVSLWAFLWVFGSIATLITPPRGETPHLDVTGFSLGLALLVASAFARWRPHPLLFLVDAIWFSCVAVQLTSSVLVRGSSYGWFAMVALMIWMAITGVKHFFRFREVRLYPSRI